MTSRRKRNLMLAGKWAGYFVLLLLAACCNFRRQLSDYINRSVFEQHCASEEGSV